MFWLSSLSCCLSKQVNGLDDDLEGSFLKRFFKFASGLLAGILIAFAAVHLGPAFCVRLFGDQNTQWISERFSETLLEKNELIVYNVETTGQETVTQDAWLIGTVQKVTMPYNFQLNYTVDLSLAEVATSENKITVTIPLPVAGYHKLTVDEENVQKTDWLYPLTPEHYAQIKNELEEKLFKEYSANINYQNAAWDVAVNNLETLFQSVASQSLLGTTCTIQITQMQ